MAVYFTNTVRVKSGHMQEALALAPKAVAAYEKLGVKFHGQFQAVGGEANVLVYLVSLPDFASWGDLLQKAAADADLQAITKEQGEHNEGNVIQALAPLPNSSMQ